MIIFAILFQCKCVDKFFTPIFKLFLYFCCVIKDISLAKTSTLSGLSEDTDYNDVKTKHIKFIEDNTDSKVLYYKLYRKKGYLGCGDVTIDTKLGLDNLLDKEKFKDFDILDGHSGVFYKYNTKKSLDDSKNESVLEEGEH